MSSTGLRRPVDRPNISMQRTRHSRAAEFNRSGGRPLLRDRNMPHPLGSCRKLPVTYILVQFRKHAGEKPMAHRGSNNKHHGRQATQPAARGVFGSFTLIKKLGSGGNGEVWLASSQAGVPDVAIKFLTKQNSTAYERFRSEINVLMKLNNHAGVVPIVDHHLPAKRTPGPAWYAMPVCQPISPEDFTTPQNAVAAMSAVAKSLCVLHSNGVFHRDLKLSNLLSMSGSIVLSDFGLADWADAPDITGTNEQVGARWTIAPEMRRRPRRSNSAAADVYSFAKMLWIALSRSEKGFDGQYSPLLSADVGLRHLVPNVKFSAIESILERSTQHDPTSRPSMQEVHAALEEWLKADGDFKLSGALEWKFVQLQVFGQDPPHRATWDAPHAIVRVLNSAVCKDNLNHCFVPRAGGMDLRNCSASGNDVTFGFGIPYIARVRWMEAVLWADCPEWSYFWIEFDEVLPFKAPDDEEKHEYDYLVLLPSGELVSTEGSEDGVFETPAGERVPLPEGWRHVVRILSGSLVVFAKTSPYNSDSSTYDARHIGLGPDRFYSYIRAHVEWTRNGSTGVPAVSPEGPPPIGHRRVTAPCR
jgi:hypothetical protein